MLILHVHKCTTEIIFYKIVCRARRLFSFIYLFIYFVVYVCYALHIEEHLNSSIEFIKWFHLNWSLSLCIAIEYHFLSRSLALLIHMGFFVSHLACYSCVTVRLIPLSLHKMCKCSTGNDYANLAHSIIVNEGRKR